MHVMRKPEIERAGTMPERAATTDGQRERLPARRQRRTSINDLSEGACPGLKNLSPSK